MMMMVVWYSIGGKEQDNNDGHRFCCLRAAVKRKERLPSGKRYSIADVSILSNRINGVIACG